MSRFASALLERNRPATIVYYNAKFLEPFQADARFSIRELADPALAHGSAVITLG